MNNYMLNFDEYCWSTYANVAPETGGIYCVYSCNRVGSQLMVERLLYIRQTDSFRRRFCEHHASDKFAQEVSAGKLLLFTYAGFDGRSLDACEAAMIYHFQPPYNSEHKDRFVGYAQTSVTCSGKWAFRVAGTFTQAPTA